MSRYQTIMLSLALCALFSLPCAFALAQSATANLGGTVVDEKGAVVPDVRITVINNGTALQREVTTNADGYFMVPLLPPGSYTVTAKREGFAPVTHREVVLNANDQRALEIQLKVGGVGDTVTVTGNAAIQLASAERAGHISGDQLNNIALKGRDFFALLQTIPGVVDTYSQPRETTSTGAIGGTHINGGRENQKNFTVDGITSMNIGANKSIPVQPNLDSIAEVKVLTSNYQAEYGRHGAGILTVITKSGARDFHGTAYNFYRHESLNANNFFNNRTGSPKLPYRYRITGYSIGGPIYIPKRFNTDKGKLFFFFSQEFAGTKRDFGTRFVNTPTELERRGDFSQSFDLNGALIVVRDPLTGQPFPNNVIPSNRIDKSGQAILNFFPLPNYTDPDPRNRYRWNHRSAYSGAAPRRNEVLRIDANLTPSLTMYYRFIQNQDETVLPWGDWKLNSPYFLVPIRNMLPGRGHVARVTRTFSPTLVNEFTFGHSLAVLGSEFVDQQPLDRSRIGNLPQWFADEGLPNYIPDLGFGGQPASAISARLGVSPYRYSDPVYQITDNLSKVWKSHSIKAGIYIERGVIDSLDERPLWRGSFNFSRDTNNPFDSNHSFANALLGNFRSYTETTSRPRKDLLQWNIEWYVQDNWRVDKRLTLDLGLRVYHVPPMYDRLRQTAAFNPALYDPSKAPALYLPAINSSGQRVAIDPITKTLAPAPLIGRFVPGSGDFANGSRIGGVNAPQGLYDRPGVFLDPRFGFAYDLFGNGKTALRGGFGFFHDIGQQNQVEQSTGNPPVTFAPTLFYGNLGTFAGASGAVGPSDLLQPPVGRGKLPQVMQFSLGLQREIWDTVIDISYVGSLARHLQARRDLNPIPMFARFDLRNEDPTRPGRPLPDNFLRLYRGYGRIRAFEYVGTANYNSLQIGANRRFRRGLQFGLAYTWSKALGIAGDDYDTISPYFAPRQRNYGPLFYDRPHVFVANYMYDLPRVGIRIGWTPARWILDEWQISGITAFVSGAPFTPAFSTTDGQDITGSQEGPRITVIGNPRLNKSARTLSRNFNTGAFARTPQGSFGNAGVGILRGPGVNNWDMALTKRIPLRSEERFIQFRTELFNAWNHTQLSGMFTTARFDAVGNQADPNFGAYSSARPARILQFSLKVVF